MSATPIVPGLLYYARGLGYAAFIPAANGVVALERFLEIVFFLTCTTNKE